MKMAKKNKEKRQEILLIGNPNVGKSVIFNKLTDSDVEVANYTGTTVGYTRTKLDLDNGEVDLIDVPGTYSLEHTSEAEEVAVKFFESDPRAIVQVLDATHLERNLKLALEARRYNIPTIYVLNLMDVADRQGIKINIDKLQDILQAPVIPAIAVKGEGLEELKLELNKIIKEEGKIKDRKIDEKLSEEELWKEVERINEEVQVIGQVKADRMERLGNLTIKPWPGIPIAIVVMILSLAIVVGVGKGLRAAILLPFVNNVYAPIVTGLVTKFIGPGMVQNILIGEYGFLIKMVEWPLALILPYVFLFYIVLTFLEDSGYLPRIGVMMDALLSKLGIQGGSMISILLGYGCAIPAIISTRASSTKKERLIVTLMIAFAVPCVSQTGAFISLLGDYSILLLLSVYLVSFLGMIVVAKIGDKFISGETSPMVLEVPNLLIPDKKSYFRKLRFRMKAFLLDAELPMFIGIAFAAIVVESGIMNRISLFIEPVVVRWLGLPKEASISLILGIIRRELAVLPLMEMNLNGLQMFVGSIMALFYLPCLSVFAIIIEEFNNKIGILITLSTIIVAIVIAGTFNQIGQLILSGRLDLAKIGIGASLALIVYILYRRYKSARKNSCCGKGYGRK